MPADYLSRLPSACNEAISEITEGFDPFQPDLHDLQKADDQLQSMNHFKVHGKWFHPIPKKEASYLQNLAPKLFQDSNKLVWVRLDDYKYPRTALYLPQKYRKLALCKAHNNQFGGHNAELKTYIRISSSYFWPKIYTDVLNHTKTCFRCQQRKSSTNKPPPRPISPMHSVISFMEYLSMWEFWFSSRKSCTIKVLVPVSWERRKWVSYRVSLIS